MSSLDLAVVAVAIGIEQVAMTPWVVRPRPGSFAGGILSFVGLTVFYAQSGVSVYLSDWVCLFLVGSGMATAAMPYATLSFNRRLAGLVAATTMWMGGALYVLKYNPTFCISLVAIVPVSAAFMYTTVALRTSLILILSGDRCVCSHNPHFDGTTMFGFRSGPPCVAGCACTEYESAPSVVLTQHGAYLASHMSGVVAPAMNAFIHDPDLFRFRPGFPYKDGAGDPHRTPIWVTDEGHLLIRTETEWTVYDPAGHEIGRARDAGKSWRHTTYMGEDSVWPSSNTEHGPHVGFDSIPGHTTLGFAQGFQLTLPPGAKVVVTGSTFHQQDAEVADHPVPASPVPSVAGPDPEPTTKPKTLADLAKEILEDR